MNSIVKYLSGKKTYIIALASVVYAILALDKLVPNPDKLGILILQVGALSVGFRAALQKLTDILSAK